MLLAASTQRTIAWVLALLVTVPVIFLAVRRAFAVITKSDPEVGSEIELAPNRLPAVPDEFLEGTRLDRSLGAGLVTLAIIGVTLPLYWLGEPGRIDGADIYYDTIFTSRGANSYEENCTACHGAGGTAGIASFTLTDAQGNYVSQVSWAAPALNTVLTRMSEEEVTHVLNYGRNGVMPAWGGPGGGPMTTQRVRNLVYYMRSIQLDTETIHANVRSGVEQRRTAILFAEDPDTYGVANDDGDLIPNEAAIAAGPQLIADVDAMLAPLRSDAEALLASRIAGVDRLPEGEIRDLEQAKIQGQIENMVAAKLLEDDFADEALLLEWGEALFSNRADGGVYGCARCHTKGFSYEAVESAVRADGTPVQDSYIQGGGAFGPSLTDGATLERFAGPLEQQGFISLGSSVGVNYGSPGATAQGSGQMPGFGARSEGGNDYNELLSPPEIAAIVAYERNL